MASNPSNLLVVESPAKARTIKKYLGKDFEVLASYGHVRDLRPKEGAVETGNRFLMHYEPVARNEKHITALRRAMKKSGALYLATDPDREGEAISWHVMELLKEKNLLKDKPVHRVVFHEITQRAIREAIDNAREISMPLVNAQQARRALDYLVGFNLSPLLWKKIRRGLSAGRVQSPALRMIVERQEEIEKFKAREYWTLKASMQAQDQPFAARLVRFEGKKLGQFDIAGEEQAKSTKAALEQRAGGELTVYQVEKKQRKRNPAPPFITSTLQQDAVRKLRFTAQRAMRIAQQLYEGIDTGSGSVGLITYMRTDSVTLAQEAISEIRDFITDRYGADEVPKRQRQFTTKSKNAQEAHEAVRPTSVFRTPDQIKEYLNDDQRKLYELIWKRTVACQMVHATIDTVAVDFTHPAAAGEEAPPDSFRATGSTIARPGFMAVYEVETSGEEPEHRLPPLAKGQTLELSAVDAQQHFTEPPPRYTEASLIRTLEEYGIGRPSTYASIISTLVQREYVELESRRFTPTDVGRLVNGFLTEHFTNYVDYDFTARLEDDLDAISRGEREWVPLMEGFWAPFEQQVKEKDANVSRKDAARARELGEDSASGKKVMVRMGRYGPYAQIGAAEDEDKPRFAGLRQNQSLDTITLDQALELFKLPRDLGATPEDEPVLAGVGRFGPYIKYGTKYVSLPKEDDPHTVDLPRALELVVAKKLADANKEIKTFEAGGIRVLNGRYGPYITDGSKNVKVPKNREPADIELEEAKELLSKAPARAKGRKKTRSTARAR